MYLGEERKMKEQKEDQEWPRETQVELLNRWTRVTDSMEKIQQMEWIYGWIDPGH